MFIRKNHYEEMKSDYFELQRKAMIVEAENNRLKSENERLRKMDEISETRIAGYVQKVDELNVEVASLKSNLSIMKNRFNTSEEIRIKLIDQNGRLIDLLERYMEKEEEENESKI